MGKKRRRQRRGKKVGIENEEIFCTKADRMPVEEDLLETRRKRIKTAESTEVSIDGRSSPDEGDGQRTTEISTFPYPTESDDHCESPKEAYRHIIPLLKTLHQKPNLLQIYDPYYCDGAVQRNLEELGFPNVYNREEDCYRVWEKADLPAFDVLITNPPYSADHIEKLINFVTSPAYGCRPWFLLLPQWVHKKEYFLNAIGNGKHMQPFYIVPRKRYVYVPPVGFRQARISDTHKKSSPFVSMWYVFGGTSNTNQALIRSFFDNASDGECDLARSKSALRDLRRKKR